MSLCRSGAAAITRPVSRHKASAVAVANPRSTLAPSASGSTRGPAGDGSANKSIVPACTRSDPPSGRVVKDHAEGVPPPRAHGAVVYGNDRRVALLQRQDHRP